MCVAPTPPHRKDHEFHFVDSTDAMWFSLPAHILLPQRTTQFAYSLDLAVLLLVLVAHTRAGAIPKPKADVGDDTPVADAVDGDNTRGSATTVASTPNKPHDSGVRRRAGKGDTSVVKTGKQTPTPAKGKEKRNGRVKAEACVSPYEAGGVVTSSQKLLLHVCAGVATGLLPLAHPHSFVAVGTVLAVAALCDTLQRLGECGVRVRSNGIVLPVRVVCVFSACLTMPVFVGVYV